MKRLNLATMAAALLLAGSTLGPLALAADTESVQQSGGISYVSGGVGADSTARMNSLAKDFNLKLVFALKSGDYVSEVAIAIVDAAGKQLLDTKSEGPLFLTRLPRGSFKIAATFGGRTETRTVAISAEKLQTIDFRFSAE